MFCVFLRQLVAAGSSLSDFNPSAHEMILVSRLRHEYRKAAGDMHFLKDYKAFGFIISNKFSSTGMIFSFLHE